MKIFILILILILQKEAFSQACLESNLIVDPTCGCQIKNNCYKFFNNDYFQAVKKVSGTNPKLIKVIIENQKATTSAFNKIMSNKEITPAELEAIKKESAILEKLNQRSLATLNELRIKNRKPILKPDRDALESKRKLIASLSPAMQKIVNSQAREIENITNNNPGHYIQDENLDDDESKQEDNQISDTSSIKKAEIDEAQLMEERVAQESKKDFDYTTEINSEKSKVIFGLISHRYQKVILKKDALPYHADSDKDRSLKSEIKEDIHQVLKNLDR